MVWDITQRRLVITTFRGNPSIASSRIKQSKTLKDWTDRLSRNVCKLNYHYTLRSDPEERRYYLNRDGRLKSIAVGQYLQNHTVWHRKTLESSAETAVRTSNVSIERVFYARNSVQ